MLLFGKTAVTALSISAGYILKTFPAARHYVKSANTDVFPPGTHKQFFFSDQSLRKIRKKLIDSEVQNRENSSLK